MADAHQLRTGRTHKRIGHFEADAVKTAGENRHQVRFNRLTHGDTSLLFQGSQAVLFVFLVQYIAHNSAYILHERHNKNKSADEKKTM